MIRRIKDLPLFQQLITPLLFLTLFTLSATIYSALEVKESVLSLGEIYQHGDRRLRTLEELETELAYFRNLSLRHITSESASEMAELETNLQQTRSLLQENVRLLSDHHAGDNDSQVTTTRLFHRSIDSYLQRIDKALFLSNDFEKERAFESLTQTENDYLSVISQTVQHLKRHEFEYLDDSRNALVDTAGRNLLLTTALGIGGVVLLLFIAFQITRRTTVRLSSLLTWSQRFASGELTTPLTEESKDEVGQLAMAMCEMGKKIQSAHSELARAKFKAENVAEALQVYAKAFEKSGEAIIITDRNNNIVNVNETFTNQTGYPLDAVKGKNPSLLASGNTSRETYDEMWQALQEHNFWQGELWDRKSSGEIYPKWTAISAIRDEAGEIMFYIASFTDISERKEAEARIEHLAHHDILTGLQNRFSLEERLAQSLHHSQRDDLQLAVLFIDLDRFKTINDTLGHQVGDQLLIKVADRLTTCLRSSDIVARVGGDEFIVVINGMNNNAQAAFMAEKIQRHLVEPYLIDNNRIETSPSIGISIFPYDGNSVDELMRNADIAMYHAKDQGRNNYRFFTESMLTAAHERMALERQLRSALGENELELYYQPQIDTQTDRISGLEALIRWHHPEQGMIPPDQFIPLAEESGLILELGYWVIDEACRQLAEWKAAGLNEVHMAINLSARQLHAEQLTQRIAVIMDVHGIEGTELELEITETAAMLDPELAVTQLHALRKLGIGLAIDDFGTGYSSLAYLKRLPIQVLKLDRTFVRDIESDPNDAEISAATVALAHNLGMKVVAEGVETEAQQAFLKRLKCDYLQGYLFSKPRPASDLTPMLPLGNNSNVIQHPTLKG